MDRFKMMCECNGITFREYLLTRPMLSCPAEPGKMIDCKACPHIRLLLIRAYKERLGRVPKRFDTSASRWARYVFRKY